MNCIKRIFSSIKNVVDVFKATKEEIEYFNRTGNIPMCKCKSFLTTDTCSHIRKLRRKVNKWINSQGKGWK